MTAADPIRRRPTARFVAILAVIGLVAIVLRWIAIRNTWGFGQDQYTYLETARILRDREWDRVWTFRMLHPLYPMMIAAVGAVVSDWDAASRWISLVSTVACALGAAWLWWRWRDDEGEALAVGAVFALHHGLVLAGSETLTEGPTMPFALALLAVCARSRRTGFTVRDAAVAGLLAGVVTLLKTTCLLLLPGAILAAAWPTLRARNFAALRRPAGVFLLTFLPLAVAPHVATYATQGRLIDFVGRESRVTDSPVLAGRTPVAEVDDSGEVAPTAVDLGEHVFARKLWTNTSRLFTYFGPRLLWPWFVAVPLFLLGVRALRRIGGAAWQFWVVAAASIAFEWGVRCGFVIVDRYLIPGTLALLPPIAVGACECVRIVAARKTWPVWTGALPGAVLAGAWGWVFFRAHLEPGLRPNIYQVLGAKSAALGDARPKVLGTIDSQVCWYAKARRIRIPDGPAKGVLAVAERVGCDGIVVGPGELLHAPEFRAALDAPLGGEWNGLRVVAKVEAAGGSPGAAVLMFRGSR